LVEDFVDDFFQNHCWWFAGIPFYVWEVFVIYDIELRLWYIVNNLAFLQQSALPLVIPSLDLANLQHSLFDLIFVLIRKIWLVPDDLRIVTPIFLFFTWKLVVFKRVLIKLLFLWLHSVERVDFMLVLLVLLSDLKGMLLGSLLLVWVEWLADVRLFYWFAV